eukprot:gene3269-624_t
MTLSPSFLDFLSAGGGWRGHTLSPNTSGSPFVPSYTARSPTKPQPHSAGIGVVRSWPAAWLCLCFASASVHAGVEASQLAMGISLLRHLHACIRMPSGPRLRGILFAFFPSPTAGKLPEPRCCLLCLALYMVLNAGRGFLGIRLLTMGVTPFTYESVLKPSSQGTAQSCMIPQNASPFSASLCLHRMLTSQHGRRKKKKKSAYAAPRHPSNPVDDDKAASAKPAPAPTPLEREATQAMMLAGSPWFMQSPAAGASVNTPAPHHSCTTCGMSPDHEHNLAEQVHANHAKLAHLRHKVHTAHQQLNQAQLIAIRDLQQQIQMHHQQFQSLGPCGPVPVDPGPTPIVDGVSSGSCPPTTPAMDQPLRSPVSVGAAAVASEGEDVIHAVPAHEPGPTSSSPATAPTSFPTRCAPVGTDTASSSSLGAQPSDKPAPLRGSGSSPRPLRFARPEPLTADDNEFPPAHTFALVRATGCVSTPAPASAVESAEQPSAYLSLDGAPLPACVTDPALGPYPAPAVACGLSPAEEMPQVSAVKNPQEQGSPTDRNKNRKVFLRIAAESSPDGSASPSVGSVSPFQQSPEQGGSVPFPQSSASKSTGSKASTITADPDVAPAHRLELATYPIPSVAAQGDALSGSTAVPSHIQAVAAASPRDCNESSVKAAEPTPAAPDSLSCTATNPAAAADIPKAPTQTSPSPAPIPGASPITAASITTKLSPDSTLSSGASGTLSTTSRARSSSQRVK